MFFLSHVFAMPLCASVYVCLVVTCWERADIFARVCGVDCEFVTFPLIISIPDLCTLIYIVGCTHHIV